MYQNRNVACHIHRRRYDASWIGLIILNCTKVTSDASTINFLPMYLNVTWTRSKRHFDLQMLKFNDAIDEIFLIICPTRLANGRILNHNSSLVILYNHLPHIKKPGSLRAFCVSAYFFFFARPANGLSEVRNESLIGTPGISKVSRRPLMR